MKSLPYKTIHEKTRKLVKVTGLLYQSLLEIARSCLRQGGGGGGRNYVTEL